MALTTVNITGTFNFPDATWTDYAKAEFVLSGYDTDTEVVTPNIISTVLTSSGGLDVDLWGNDDGERGTVYRVCVVIYTDDSYTDEVKRFDFGRIQISGDAALDIATLLDSPAGVPGAWYSSITDAEYDAAIQAVADAKRWATEAEDTPVEPGEYSAKHWAAKAADDAQIAEDARDDIVGLNPTATQGPEGTQPSASWNPVTGEMAFVIPKGDKGDTGPKGDPGEDGDLTNFTDAQVAQKAEDDGRFVLGTQLQSSPSDTTANAILKMNSNGFRGPFGLGGISGYDLNGAGGGDTTTAPSGFVRYPGPVNSPGVRPEGHSNYGTGIQARYDEFNGFGLYQGINRDQLAFRRLSTTWQPWQHIAATPGGPHIQQRSFSTRADFVSAVSDIVVSNGDIVMAGGLAYVAVNGSTMISDLSGFEPAGAIIYSEHFGVVAADTITSTAYGDDQYSKISDALDAAILLQKEIRFPRGYYRMGSRYSKNGSQDLKFVLKGDGTDKTYFVVDLNENVDGWLYLNATSAANRVQVEIRDCSVLVADSSGATGTVDGRGLFIGHNASLRAGVECILENFDIVSHENDQAAFERGVELNGLWWPRVYNCRINQFLRGNVDFSGTSFRSGWPPYAVESAIYIRNCYGIVAKECIFRCGGGNLGAGGGTVGSGAPIFIDYTGGAEGGQFVNCTSNYGIVGVRVRGVDNEPGFQWDFGHVNARDVCMQIESGQNGRINGPLLYLDDGSVSDGLGTNADASSIPRLIEFGTGCGTDWLLENINFHYAGHTHISDGRYIWARQTTTGLRFYLSQLKQNASAAMSYGWFSDEKHIVFATACTFNYNSTPWNNDLATGYQFETGDGIGGRQIYGVSDPNGTTMPGTLTNRDTFYRADLTAGSAHYRYDGTGTSWTRTAI